MWTASEPCGKDQVCVDGSQGATCADALALCAGHEGGAVCDGPVMHVCDGRGVSVETHTCDGDQHCAGGIEAHACLGCLDGEYRCDGEELQTCKGGAFSTEQVCPSASLCSAPAKRCTAQACNPEEFTCDAETSRQCNGDGSALLAGVGCEYGCNRTTGRCHACPPSTNRCEDNTRYTCSAQGTEETSMACPDRCGNGECVECTAQTADLDCAAEGACGVVSCVGGSCSEAFAQAGSPCERGPSEGGYCDAQGNCDECYGSGKAQCPGPFDQCMNGTCARDAPSCSPTCAVGQACQLDQDCQGQATCDAAGRVCTQTCTGNYQVTSAADIDDIRYCSAITGDLHLELTFSMPAEDQAAFSPYLTSVGGVLTIRGDGVSADQLTFPKLSTAGGLTLFGGARTMLSFPALREIQGEVAGTVITERLELPALTRIRGTFVVLTGAGPLGRIHLPALQRVDGDFALQGTNITTVNVQQLNTIAGSLVLQRLCTLSYDEVSHLSAPVENVSNIGCCSTGLFPPVQYMCDGGCVCP